MAIRYHNNNNNNSNNFFAVYKANYNEKYIMNSITVRMMM